MKLWLDWNRAATSDSAEMHENLRVEAVYGVLLLFFVLGDSKVQFGFRDASQETKCGQSEQRESRRETGFKLRP